MPDSLRRPLIRALFVSLVLHFALLVGVADPFVRFRTSPAMAISAVLLSAGVAEVPLATPPAKHTPPRKAPPVAVPESSGSRSNILAVSRSSPEEVGYQPANPAEAPAGAVTKSASVAPAPAPADSASTVESVAPSGSTVSADDLRQYRVSLAVAARRFKRYPALARERGWEGVAEVAIIIAAQSPVPRIGLAASSGSSVLDEQALEMVAQAARTTVLPDGLKGRDLRLLLPVKFSLGD